MNRVMVIVMPRGVSSWPQLTLPYILDICVQLASGVRHLHACGILHRDLKSDNALVAGLTPVVVKWADFGCSVKLAGRVGSATYGCGKLFGTRRFTAGCCSAAVTNVCSFATAAVVCLFVCLLFVTANQYTKLVAPLAWRACETFIPHKSAGTIVTEASDVFMLGCTFIEVLTACSREPYDWLMEEDPSGMTLITYRTHESTRNNNPLMVSEADHVTSPWIVVALATMCAWVLFGSLTRDMWLAAGCDLCRQTVLVGRGCQQ